MSTPKECGLLGRCFYAECHCKPAHVSATEPEFPATFLFAPDSAEPKMLPAVEWLREEAHAWTAFKGDEHDEPNTAHTLNGIADYIDTLRARVAEAERVTEEQVERAALAYFNDSLMGPDNLGNKVYDWDSMTPEIRNAFLRSTRLALTAARGGG